ncbi:MAG: hypothetical protein ACRDWW_02910, partial [Acidimicrobiales bacterium]
MSFDASTLQSELLDAGQALGLIDGSGNLNPDWFDSPFGHLESILTDDTQRAALLKALEGILPSDSGAPATSSEHWHPLLGTGRSANVYLVVTEDGTGPVTLSAAVAASGPEANLDDPTKPSARLAVRVPLITAGASGLSVVAATPSGPVDVELRVVIGLTRSGGSPIGLAAARAAVLLDLHSDPTVKVTLEGLDLGDPGGPGDVALDPQNLSSEAARVAVGLLRSVLADTAGLSGAELA